MKKARDFERKKGKFWVEGPLKVAVLMENESNRLILCIFLLQGFQTS